MEQSSNPKSEKTIRHQFDSFAKMVLRGEVSNYEKELARRAQREKTFSELSEQELNELKVFDKYPSDFFNFSVLDFDVAVENPDIGAALEALPDKKRDIVLLSYFLDMSDTEIARRLNLANSTIHFHKERSLKMLKKLLEEGKADE